MSDYFDTSGDPSEGSALESAVPRAEFVAIAAAFAKIAAYTGNAGKAVVINAGGTAQTVTTGTLALAGNFATTGAYNTTLGQQANTTVTLPTTNSVMARTDAAQTFTGAQTFAGALVGAASQDVFNTISTTINAFGAASTALTIGHASAAAAFPGGISIPTGKTLSGAGAISITGTLGVTGAATLAALSATTGAFSGVLSSSAAGENVKYTTTASGTEGSSQYVAWYRSNGSTRKGYVGFPNNDTSSLTINSVGAIDLAAGTSVSINAPTSITSTTEVDLLLSSSNADAANRNWGIKTNVSAYGQWGLYRSTSAGAAATTNALLIDGAAGAVTIPGTLGVTGAFTYSGAINGGVEVNGSGSTKTVGATEEIVANAYVAGTQTITLPDAATYPGRKLTIFTKVAQLTISNASNVYPLGSVTAGTAILDATIGKWADLVSDGTAWRILRAG